MAYGISGRAADMKPTWITSAEILAMLDPENVDHVPHIAAINNIEANGIRYSGQDFDVLAAAHRTAIV